MANLKSGSTVGGLPVLGKAGTDSYIAKLSKDNTLINSLLYDNGTNVGIGNTNPTEKLEVTGNVKASSFIGSLAWSNISSKPTTISGFGITDAIVSSGVPSMSSGSEASRPAAGSVGRLYIASDTKRIFRDTGSVWDQVGGQDTIAWSNISSKPTTLGGYGITDAASSSHNHDSVYLKIDGSTSATGKISIQKASQATSSINNNLYNSGQIEMRSAGADVAAIGFHRPGYTGLALYHDGDFTTLKLKGSDNSSGYLWTTLNFDPNTKLDKSSMGLFSTNGGQDFLGRGKRIIVATETQLIINYGGDFSGGIVPQSSIFMSGNNVYFQDNTAVGIINNSGTAWVRAQDGNGNLHLRNYWGANYHTSNTHYFQNRDGGSYGYWDGNGLVVDNGWFRAKGQNGFYFQDYGGGFNMSDGTWIRTYGNKSFYCSSTLRGERVEAVRMIIPVGTNAWG